MTDIELIADKIRSLAMRKVLEVRGSCDAPAFDICVKSEIESMCENIKETAWRMI